MIRSYRVAWRFTLAIAALHTVYMLLVIWKSSFVVEGERYFCLWDDAMISMCHAANWAQGHGFVWNVGERVEGYTNFGWTVVMGLCHLLRLTPSGTCLLVQVLGIPILWSCLFGTVRLARACRVAPSVALAAGVLTITQWDLNLFTLLGMETGLLTALVVFALADVCRALRHQEGGVRPMIWFAAAYLVRPDVFLLFALSAGLLFVVAPRHRWRTVVGVGMVAAVVCIHLLWRHSYYGEWFPNTYYLKATGWGFANRIRVGMQTGIWTLASLGAPLALGAACIVRPRLWQLLLVGGFVLTCCYQVSMGGEPAPRLHRFVLPATPGLMVFACQGIRVWCRLLGRGTSAWVGRIVLALACALAVNSLHLDRWLLRSCPHGTLTNQVSVRLVHAVDRVVDPEATVAVARAGVFPYFSGRRCFDLFGKCDAQIAHRPVRFGRGRAGHNKFDSEFTLSAYHPDVVVGGLVVMTDLFFETYRPVKVEVDGTTLMVAVRESSNCVHGGEPITWAEGRRLFQQMRR